MGQALISPHTTQKFSHHCLSALKRSRVIAQLQFCNH